MGCMRMCPCFSHLKVTALCVLVVACRFEAIFKQRFGRTFSYVTNEDWKHKSEGVTSFKMPTMQHDTLWLEDVMWEGYRPKMLLYSLDELFYIYDQVKCQRGVDEKLVVAYETLSLTTLHGTLRMGGKARRARCCVASESE